MSVRLKEKVTCPKCGFQYEVECAPGVNGAADPDLKEQLLTGNAFVRVCPSCGVTTRLVYPVMYQDPKKGFAIYFLPRTEKDRVERQGDMQGLLEGEDFARYRLVDDCLQLAEKIRLFDAGLDDRAMELFKAYTALSMMGKPEGGFVPDSMLYVDQTKDGRFSFLCVRDEENRQLTVPGDLYHEIASAAHGILGDEITSHFVMVDLLWALNTLKDHGNLLSGAKLN